MGSSESSPVVDDTLFKRTQSVTLGETLFQNALEGPIPQPSERIYPETRAYAPVLDRRFISFSRDVVHHGDIDHTEREDDHSKTAIPPICPRVVTCIDVKFLLSIDNLLNSGDGDHIVVGLTGKPLLTMSLSGVNGKNFTLKITFCDVNTPLLTITASPSEKTELHASHLPAMQIYNEDMERYGTLKINDGQSASLRLGDHHSRHNAVMQVAVVNVACLESRLFDLFGDIVGEAKRSSSESGMHCFHVARNKDYILLLGCLVASMLRLYHEEPASEEPTWWEALEETIEHIKETIFFEENEDIEEADKPVTASL